MDVLVEKCGADGAIQKTEDVDEFVAQVLVPNPTDHLG